MFCDLIRGSDVMLSNESPSCFSLLVGAVQTAGMTELLNQQAALTFFAPTNAAFSAMPPPELNKMMGECNRRILCHSYNTRTALIYNEETL